MKKIILTFLILTTMQAVGLSQERETTWMPDTCNGCEVVFTWDDSVPQDKRVHTVKDIFNLEDTHKLKTKEKQFEDLWEESRRKNYALDAIKEADPELTEVTDSGAVVFKKNIKVSWSYDNYRVLTIGIEGDPVLEQTKPFLEDAMEEKVGKGKVKIS